MKTPTTPVPRKIEQATSYGRELARLNVPIVMIGEMSASELDDLVDNHINEIAGRMRMNSDMTVRDMAKAIDNVCGFIRAEFAEEAKRMLLNHSTRAGRA